MRSLIQYDFDEPPSAQPIPLVAPPHPFEVRPTKKHKRNRRNLQKNQPAQPQRTPIQHWDDPGNVAVGVIYDEQEGSAAPLDPVEVSTYRNDVEEEEHGEEGDEEDNDESRPLTLEDIWDDSALVDAWHSAEAEYEAFHGSSKAWKTEPVKKSPLWYNKLYIPPGLSKRSNNNFSSGEIEPDTAPLDFNTYVPTHDPSLGIPSTDTANPASNTTPFFVPPPSTTMVSRDEAFNNALSAMYWSGYWTAVHHCQSQSSQKKPHVQGAIEENGIETDEDEDEEDLVPTQR